MAKAVLISIRPKWCEKIISGEKTIEVRKNRPKLETPFKAYIYCTKGRPDRNIPIYQERLMQDYLNTGSMKSLNCPHGNGKVIGEFTCAASTSMTMIRFSRSDMRTTRVGTILALTVRVCTRKISRITLTASGCTAGIYPTLKSTISRESYESSRKATVTVFMLILGLQKETAMIAKIQDAF